MSVLSAIPGSGCGPVLTLLRCHWTHGPGCSRFSNLLLSPIQEQSFSHPRTPFFVPHPPQLRAAFPPTSSSCSSGICVRIAAVHCRGCSDLTIGLCRGTNATLLEGAIGCKFVHARRSLPGFPLMSDSLCGILFFCIEVTLSFHSSRHRIHHTTFRFVVYPFWLFVIVKYAVLFSQ